VAVDADTYYPPNFLNLFLRHFQRPEVTAVSGPRLYPHGIYRYATTWAALLGPRRLYGSNSAFRRNAYFQSGGFNLAVNQLHGPSILREEEFNFYSRMREVGEVVFDRQATAFTSDRRFTDKEFQEQVSSGVRFKQKKEYLKHDVVKLG